MKMLKLSVIVLITVLIASCKGEAPKTDQQPGDDSTTVATNEEVKSGKFGIKSGIVEYTTKMMNMDINQTITFDDFGAKQLTESIMDFAGTNMSTVTLMKDGYIYTYDLNSKIGTKQKMVGINGADIDFRNLTAEMEKQMNIKKEGKEDYAGKTCEKYSIDYKEGSMKGTFLVWEGIALKTDVEL